MSETRITSPREILAIANRRNSGTRTYRGRFVSRGGHNDRWLTFLLDDGSTLDVFDGDLVHRMEIGE